MAKLLSVLFLLGAILAYWKFLLTVAVILVLVTRGPGWVDYWLARRAARREVERNRLAAICARADEQHAWALRGDPRGTYGAYPPAC